MAKMSITELYKHITKHMSAEDALMRLLEGHVITYEKLKFNEGDEIHPIMLISMAAFEMGWQIAIPKSGEDDEVIGLTVGTKEYLEDLFPSNLDDHPNTSPVLLDTKDNDIGIGKLFVEKNTVFVGNGQELLKFSENNDIYVKGRLAKNDKEVVDAFRNWLKSVNQLINQSINKKYGNQDKI